MKLLLFIISVFALYSCTESWASMQQNKPFKDKAPQLYNCTLIASTDYWAMYEVKTKDGGFIVVEGESGIEVLKK